MIRIPQGNGFRLRITLTEESIDIRQAADLSVNLVACFGKTAGLPFEITGSHELVARVEGELPCGTYGVEITGIFGGDDFRSMEVGMLEIVYSNSQADLAPTDVLEVQTAEVSMAVVCVGGAQKQADWAQEDDTQPDYIKNKPQIYDKGEIDAKAASIYDDMREFEENYVWGEGNQVFDMNSTGSQNVRLDTKFQSLLINALGIRGYVDGVTIAEYTLLFTHGESEVFRVNLATILNQMQVAYKNEVYTRQQTNTLLNDKADALAVDEALALKANVSDVYTKKETSNEIDSHANNALFYAERLLELEKEGQDRMNPPYTPFGGGPVTRYATLPKGLLRNNILEFCLDGDNWETDNTMLRAVCVVDGKVYWSVAESSAVAPTPSDVLKVRVRGVAAALDDKKADKSDTYTIAQVDAIVAAIKNGAFVAVATLPVASADTIGKIYLVPSANAEAGNVKDEYITLQEGNVYLWEKIGTTKIDLSDYYTKSEVNTLYGELDSFTQELYDTKAEKSEVEKFRNTLKSPQVNGNVLRFTNASNGGYEDVSLPVQIQSDWEEDDNTKKSFIKNKPQIYTKEELDALLGDMTGQTELTLPMEGADRMNPPYTLIGGGPWTKWATLPYSLEDYDYEWKIVEGEDWRSENTTSRDVEIVDGKIYWSAYTAVTLDAIQLRVNKAANVKEYIDREVAKRGLPTMRVNVTVETDEETGDDIYTADKTFAEIKQYYKDGGDVVLGLNFSTDDWLEVNLFRITFINEDSIVFLFQEGVMAEYFEIYDNGVGHWIDESMNEMFNDIFNRLDALDGGGGD